jgi:hypothetical protein
MIDTLKPLIKQFMPFARERFGFTKPPRMFLKQDQENARNPLGKTAYYDPDEMSITLYISGRHPKDIMRSLAHELVHHTQNCNGKFNHVSDMGEGYAQNDEHLREMEREAYEQGNLCFRDWEDSIKNTIYFEHLQKGVNKMSTKKWKNNELKGLLTEQWGFSMDLSKLNEKKGEKGDADPLDGKRAKFDKDHDGVPDGADKDPNDPEVKNESQEIFAPNHYCVHHGGVQHNGKIEMAEAVSHNYNTKLGRVTHYNMKLSDGTILENVAFEDIQVTNASLAEGHGEHPAKRDDKCPKCGKSPCKCPKEKKMEESSCAGGRDMDMAPMAVDVVDDMGAMDSGMDSPEAIIDHMEEMIVDLKRMLGMNDMPMDDMVMDDPMMERRGRGRDREGMQPDERRRPMNEALLRKKIREILKKVKK